jgi:hypothetical protein
MASVISARIERAAKRAEQKKKRGPRRKAKGNATCATISKGSLEKSMTIEEAKKLPPEEINRLIAEALELNYVNHPPDYFHDLNVCFEAVNALDISEKNFYWFGLSIALGTAPHEKDPTIDAPANVRAIALACVLSERKK